MDEGSQRSLSLYPAQREGVERYRKAERGRMLLAYGTGCGKTPTAILAVVERHRAKAAATWPSLGQLHILVVCPAMVRRHWCREFQRWARIQAFPIEMGRERKSGTKAALDLRDMAYEADVQVVSYDLLPQVKASGWDYVIFDEIHHLGTPTSKQSRAAQKLMAKNPLAGALGLSATLIPTEVAQIWHPLYLLFGPEQWGKPNRRGGISWDFADKYCGIERNDYGCAVGSGRAEALPDLQEKVAEVAHRITRADILPDMPPLNVRLLDIPGQKTDAVQTAMDWRAQLGTDVKKVVILTYHRSLARGVLSQIVHGEGYRPGARYIDGALHTKDRDAILQSCEDSDSCVLIATTESIREGVRLMWAEHVLLLEWRQSPAQVIQILGRFQSVGDPRKPQLDILYDESLASEAYKLIERINVVNQILAAGDAEHKVAEVFQPRELTEDRLTALTLELFADVEKSDQREQFVESEAIEDE